MAYYYEEIFHKNESDDEESVIKITSTEEEKKHIKSVLITKEVNGGTLEGYIEREKILNHSTGKATIQDFLEIELDTDLPVGQTLELKLQNEVSGTNAEIYGLIKYEIK